ncbi:MAG: hypothetical protein JWQ27_2855 [Ferruginibacter sp.]|nr:hypothetical protein [Ferruginibacter sp.]
MQRIKKISVMMAIAMLICSLPVFAQKRICVIGSSSAYGYFGNPAIYPRDSAWAFKIKKYYKDLGVIDTLYNIAASGTNPFSGMPTSYVPPPGYPSPETNLNITKAVNLNPRPDVIIVNYPSNQYDYYPVDVVMNCLQTIKDSANARNITCYITTTQPRNNFSPSERLRLRMFRDSIINRFGFFAIDFYTDVERGDSIRDEYAFGDFIHLNPTGHTVLANKVIAKNIFAGPVAIKLAALSAIEKDGQVLLQWQTQQENDNQQIRVERSIDGVHFTSIGAVAGKINSSVTEAYSFIDRSPATGKDYYRVVSVNSHAQQEYSTIVWVNFKNAAIFSSRLLAITNRNQLSILVDHPTSPKLSIRILDIQGNQVVQQNFTGNNAATYSVDITKLIAGSYILQVFSGPDSQTHRFNKL